MRLQILFRIIAAKGRLILLAESRYLSIFFLVSPWLFWLSFLIAGIAVSVFFFIFVSVEVTADRLSRRQARSRVRSDFGSKTRLLLTTLLPSLACYCQVGNSQPDKVYKAVFYCAIDNDTLTTSSTIVNGELSLCASLLLLLIES